jgi:hypothetical protein
MCKHIDTVKSLYESDEHQWMLEQIKHLEEKTFDKLDQPNLIHGNNGRVQRECNRNPSSAKCWFESNRAHQLWIWILY